MDLSNAFLVSCNIISSKCQNRNEVQETMKHMMKKTTQKLHAIYIKDLFRTLVKKKVGLAEVYNLCNRLCRKFSSGKKYKLVNTVMEWKLQDAEKQLRGAIYRESKAWREYRVLFYQNNVLREFNELWYVEKCRITNMLRLQKKKKVQWLTAKYKKKEDVPDFYEGVRIKDTVLNETFKQSIKSYGGIELNAEETAALMLPPKFKVYEKIDVTECEAEIEKALTSLRWSRKNSRPEQGRGVGDEPANVEPERVRITINDYENNSINMRNMRSTDLPFNSKTHIPKPLKLEEELPLHILREKLMKLTMDYSKNRNNKMINLDEMQSIGVKSLLEKRSNKECVMFQTDKSGNMSIDTLENYVRAAEPHIINDTVISEAEYKSLEKEFNAHSIFWTHILQAGTATKDEARVKSSMISHNSTQATTYFFRKDHKQIEPPMEPPMRPLCDASDSACHRLTYIICSILRNITNDSTTQCESTEDMLATIDELNDMNVVDEDTIVGSLDVKSLYPSLHIPDTIQICSEELYNSNQQILGIDYKETALYISLNRTKKYIEEVGLTNICPKRRYMRGMKPRMTGTGSAVKREDRFRPWLEMDLSDIDSTMQKKLLCEAVKIVLEVVLTNHVYKFNGEIRKQSSGGPIGVDLTEVVAKIFMHWWDRKFLDQLRGRGKEVHLYKRYVDDINICMKQIIENGIDDSAENRERASFRQVKEIADSIHSSIEVEVDFPSKNTGNKLPILDVKVWIEFFEEEGKHIMLYEYYLKEVSSRFVTMAKSAIPWRNKRTILTQQALTIVLNCNQKLPWQQVSEHLSYFVSRMQHSGYNKMFRYEVIKSCMVAFQKIKKDVAEKTRPIHRKKEWRKVERKKEKETKKRNWFKRRGEEAVLFVPATPGSKLAKLYREEVEMADVKIKIEEKTGRKIKNILQKNDPMSTKGCNDKTCFVCTTSQKGNCRSSSVNYRITCGCKDKCDYVYNGQTSKNGFTRGGEHIQDFEKKRDESVLLKHCNEKHAGSKQKFSMEITNVCRNDPTKRQILEAIHINKTAPALRMNDRSEWNYVSMPRATISN